MLRDHAEQFSTHAYNAILKLGVTFSNELAVLLVVLVLLVVYIEVCEENI